MDLNTSTDGFVLQTSSQHRHNFINNENFIFTRFMIICICSNGVHTLTAESKRPVIIMELGL